MSLKTKLVYRLFWKSESPNNNRTQVTTFPKAFEANVDLTAFPAGVYLVQVLAGDKILTGKIVVK